MNDLIARLRAVALGIPGVVEGESCNRMAFKGRAKGFLFVGEEGERVVVLVSLDDSLAEARALAEGAPEIFKVGATGWVTARFGRGQGAPMAVLERWIRESHRRLCTPLSAAQRRRMTAAIGEVEAKAAKVEARTRTAAKGGAVKVEAPAKRAAKTVAKVKSSAEGAAKVKSSAEGAAKVKSSAEGVAKVKSSAEGAAKVKSSAEGVTKAKSSAEGAAKAKSSAKRGVGRSR